MKTERPYPFVTIDARGTKRAQEGHPWVFDNEITAQEGTPEDGALCDVRSPKGRYLGTGYYNSHSKIRVRLLSQNANDKFDQAFFARRAQYAWDYRKTVMGPDVDSCRVIFGEADRFPGLTVDKFGDILVTQTLCLGTELRKDWIFPALVQAMEAGGQPIRGIYQRNDVKIRELEGLEQNKGWYPLAGRPLPESTQTEIMENGIRYLVDFENGQKTGFFLDQKYNRAASPRGSPCWTASPTPAPLGSTAPRPGPSGCTRWMSARRPSPAPKRTPPATASRWSTRWPTFSTCCPA